MAAVKAQFFGHSYVRRLKNFIKDADDLDFNLNLREPALIQYSGFSGATVFKLRRELSAISDFEPDFVFLLVGTNDLTKPDISPLQVSSAICDLVDTLLFVKGCHLSDIP